MDKAIRRQIKKFEKGANKAARLKEAAAQLLKRAGDIQAAQKPAFDAIILKSAYAAGLDRLPLGVVISGFAALHGTSTAEFIPNVSGVDAASVAEPVERERGADVQAGEANIDLIVKISRNTTPKRFALLDEYLVWNGKEGRWTGKVTLLVLRQFEELFEAHRLIYSLPASGFAENGASNTNASVTELLADDSKGPAELPIADGKQVDKGSDASLSDGPHPVAVASADPAATINPADNEEARLDPATEGREPAGASEPPVATTVPRSPFAGLSRRGTAAR